MWWGLMSVHASVAYSQETKRGLMVHHVTYVAWEKEERFSASGLALASVEAARKRLTHAMSFI